MAKTEKSARDLTDMIRAALGNKSEIRLAVFPNPLGWHAKVYGAGGDSLKTQEQVDQLAEQMNRHYTLAQDR